MAFLVDTNVFLRIARRTDPGRQLCLNAIWRLKASGEDLCYTTQTLMEFWNVCTRPTTARGGPGLSPAITDRKIRLIERHIRLLPENVTTHLEWRRMVATHSISGVQVYDAMLAAVMATHGISHLLTFNKDDFKRFPGITVLSPSEL